MKLLSKTEIIFLVLAFVAFIALRSIFFTYHFNFSGDQATFSTTALDIFRHKSIVFIGPPISINFHQRQLFQGPATYYMLLGFLLLGGFDPIRTSYLFMVFCALMLIPLYYGIKLLLNKYWAMLMVVIYIFAGYYIEYTRFVWNPTFQSSLIPILILLMGLFHHKKSKWLFTGLAVFLGIMLQFHYQFILIIAGLFVYYFLITRIGWIYVPLFIGGIVVGFFPVIFFDIRHQFYNFNTLILFLKNYSALDKPGGENTPHYYLSLSRMGLLTIFALMQKCIDRLQYKPIRHFNKIVAVGYISLAVVLTILGRNHTFYKPTAAFWAPTSQWNYWDEYNSYRIIKQQNLANFNVVNLGYDNKANVIKYFLKRDNIQTNYEDYYHNTYLFVIADSPNFRNDKAYEIQAFNPNKILKSWRINQRFRMYLLQKTNQF